MSVTDFSNLPQRPWINRFVSFNGDKRNGGEDKRLVQYKQRTKY